MTIGERIKNRREELGLTQDEVAKKCGYKSRSSVNKIELSRDLPLKKVSLMAKALNCTETYLMGWEDSELEIDNRSKEFLDMYRKATPEVRKTVEMLLKTLQ